MPATRTYKTPGVYLAELSSFPPSVVGVETAVPAFIGYTQTAEVGGKPVLFKPIRIGSLADYEAVFGGPHKPMYALEEVDTPTGDNYDFRVLDPASPATMKFYKLIDAPMPAVVSPPVDETGEGGQVRAAVEPEPAPPLSRFNLYNSLRLFYANGGGNAYIVSVGHYRTADGTQNTVEKQPLLDGLTAIAEQTGPTMLVVPDAVLLPPTAEASPWISADFAEVASAMLKQSVGLQDRVAILDVYGSQYVNTSDYPEADLTTVITQFRTDVGEIGLSYGMAYFPFLDTTVVPASDVTFASIDLSDGQLQQILTWENENLYRDSPRSVQVQADIDAMDTAGPAEVVKLNQNLTAALPLLKDIERIIVQMNDLLPPSGAMAGVYSYVDTTRGVWNAPANVPLYSVARPSFLLNSEQQADLNMPVDGKAVDALRQFPGRGTVVWGARTLDGNSNDYRYIQVRRTLIYIEQSIKNALNPFVFAPNTGQTWSTVVSMVSSFLQTLWSQGGLMGATASEAFSVECGLGSTMTGKDVLEGYMIVQVTLQMIRPAEFIELTFKQKMEGVS
jgi:uncharacterized protein